MKPPIWLIGLVTVVILGLLTFNVVLDAVSDEYQGYPVSLMLGGILAGLMGLGNALRKGGGGG